MTTPILGLTELAAAQSQPEVVVNAAVRGLEAVTQLVVLDITTAPPTGAAEGDRYIVDIGGVDDFTGHDEDVAYYSGGWHFFTPLPGWRAYVQGVGWYQFMEDSPTGWQADDGSGLVTSVAGRTGDVVLAAGDVSGLAASATTDTTDASNIASGTLSNSRLAAQPYDIGAMIPGAPSASLVVMRYKFPRAVAFPASLTNSQGVAGTAATAQTDFDVLKNGVSFGTIRFAAAGTSATFIAAGSSSFAAGDVLTVIAPGTPDATLADISFTLAGTR